MKKVIALTFFLACAVSIYLAFKAVDKLPENGYLLGYKLGSTVPIKSTKELIYFPFFKEARLEIIESNFGNPFEFNALYLTPKTHEIYQIVHYSWFPTHEEGRDFFNQVVALYKATYNKPKHDAKCSYNLWQWCSFQLGDLKLEMTLFENMREPEERFIQYLDPKKFTFDEMTIQELFETPEEIKGKAQFILSLEYDKEGSNYKKLKERNGEEYDELVVQKLSSKPNLDPLTKKIK